MEEEKLKLKKLKEVSKYSYNKGLIPAIEKYGYKYDDETYYFNFKCLTEEEANKILKLNEEYRIHNKYLQEELERIRSEVPEELNFKKAFKSLYK